MRTASRTERKLHAERQKGRWLQQEGFARSQRQPGTDQGRFRRRETLRENLSRTGRLDPKGTRPEQVPDQEARVLAPQSRGDRTFQIDRCRMAIAHRRNYAQGCEAEGFVMVRRV